MSTRDALARLLDEHAVIRLTAIGKFSCYGCPDRRWADHDGFAEHLADLVAAEFLVVPRSEVRIEYGVEWRNIVDSPAKSADVARHRAVHVWGVGPDAARQREVWTGPWSPLPENGDQP